MPRTETADPPRSGRASGVGMRAVAGLLRRALEGLRDLSAGQVEDDDASDTLAAKHPLERQLTEARVRPASAGHDVRLSEGARRGVVALDGRVAHPSSI